MNKNETSHNVLNVRKQEFASQTEDIAQMLAIQEPTPLIDAMTKALELAMGLLDMQDAITAVPKYTTTHHNAIQNKNPQFYQEEYVNEQQIIHNHEVNHTQVTAVAQASDHIYSLPMGIYFSTNGHFIFNYRTQTLTLGSTLLSLDDAQRDELHRVLIKDFRCRDYK